MIFSAGIWMEYLSPQNLPYSENNLIESSNSLKYTDPLNEDDIKKDVLKTVIHSSLTAKKQSDSVLHLFRIYQKFSDELIKIAIEELKSSQTISFRKFDTRKKGINLHTPFKLSQQYMIYQFTTFSPTSAVEAFKTFMAIAKNSINDSLDFSKDVLDYKKYGQLLGMSEFRTFFQNLQFNIEVPQSTVILNPDIKDHSKLVDTLALGFQLRLKKTTQEIRAEEDQEDTDLGNESLR